MAVSLQQERLPGVTCRCYTETSPCRPRVSLGSMAILWPCCINMILMTLLTSESRSLLLKQCQLDTDHPQWCLKK